MKNKAIELQVTLAPIIIMVDFEKAAINSFEQNFVDVIIKGCLFHFSQSLFKNLIKNQGMKKSYLVHEPLQLWFNVVETSLEALETDFDTVVSKISREVAVGGKKFMQYFRSTYIEGSDYPPPLSFVQAPYQSYKDMKRDIEFNLLRRLHKKKYLT